jgi:peptidyl-prolyl cis-trans isomerase C
VALLGVLLFAIERAVAPPSADQEIVVSAPAVAAMREEFRRRTGRVPSATDERSLVDAHVAEEILVREAIALGLDRGDPIVRRRLVQKMQALLENTEPVPEPSDAELEAYLAAHAARYASPDRVSLTHVFVSAQRAGGDAPAEAARLRTTLVGGGDPAGLGDPFLRGRELRLHSEAELAAVFGASFAAAVVRLPEGEWSAPVASTFGLHVVRVTERRAGVAPTLATLRRRIEADWREERRRALEREAQERLRGRYVVRVESEGS